MDRNLELRIAHRNPQRICPPGSSHENEHLLRLRQPRWKRRSQFPKLRQSEKIDVAVAFATTVSPSAGIVSTPLYHEPLVCVVRRGHPRVRRRLDLDTFLALSHVRILYPRDERVGLIDVLLRERALKRRIGIAIPHLLSVVDIVTASDLVGTVPQRMAQAWEKRGAVRMFPLPLDVPPLTVNMLYLERARFDPAHMWLRVQIEGVATTLAECQPAA